MFHWGNAKNALGRCGRTKKKKKTSYERFFAQLFATSLQQISHALLLLLNHLLRLNAEARLLAEFAKTLLQIYQPLAVLLSQYGLNDCVLRHNAGRLLAEFLLILFNLENRANNRINFVNNEYLSENRE